MNFRLLPKSFYNISVVSLGTTLSRVLGLLRDILFFSVLGAGAVSSAFLTAFTLPNLFRRLLGEGALTSAFIPVFSETLEKENKPAAFHLLNQIITRLLLVTLLLIFLGWLMLLAVQFIPGLAERHYRMSQYGLILLPYMTPICIAAIFAAALQVFNSFTAPAFSQAGLNLCIIAVLLGTSFLSINDVETIAVGLCFAVLAGGCLQVFILAMNLKNKGWRPGWKPSGSEKLCQLEALFWPGVAGAAVFQINQAFSRIIALWINDSAVSILYLANRLLELPLGVFIVSITTVSFPKLSLFAANKEYGSFANELRHRLSLIWAITAPAAVGLYLLREPILLLLFGWGAFSQEDLSETAPVLAVFALGLPFYAFSILFIKGFHALKNMRTPMRLAFFNLSLNVALGLSVVLLQGTTLHLAWTNVITAFVYCLTLVCLFKGNHLKAYQLFSGKPFLKIIFSTVVMAVFVQLSWITLQSFFVNEKINALLAVLIIIPAAAFIYGLILWLTRFQQRLIKVD